MPIRTHRGRAAVYRRFWAWPLRSPRHLAATVAGLAVLAFVLVNVLPESRSRPVPNDNPAFNGQPRTTVPFTGAGAPLTTFVPAPPQEALTQPPPPSAAPDPEAIKVGRSWVKAYVTHPAGITQAAWLDTLRPWSSEEFLPVLTSVDPGNAPDRLVGEPKVTRSEVGLVEIRQSTNIGDLAVTVSTTPKGWKVSKLARVES